MGMTAENLPGNGTRESIRTRAWRSVKRVSPFLVSLLIVLYILSRLDRRQVIASIQHANLFFFLPLMIFFVFVWFYIESQNIHALIKSYGHDFTYFDSLKMRGITYLLMIINYGLGVGGMAVYLNRQFSLPFNRARNLMIVYSFVEVAALAFMSVFGCLFVRDYSKMIENVMVFSVSIFLLYVLLYLVFQHMPEKGALAKIKNLNIVKCFCEIRHWEMLLLVFWRGIYFASFILFFYAAFQTFGIKIPLPIIAAYTPIIFFIGAIPFTPFGLGSIQAAMLYFYQDYGLPPQIFAISLAYSTLIILLRMPIGLYYSRSYKLGEGPGRDR